MTAPAQSALALRALDAIDVVVQWLVILAMAGMAGIVAIQIPLRFFLGSSIVFADELARLCFVWAVFLAVPLGIKFKRHVIVEMLVASLSPRLAMPLSRAVACVSAIIVGIVGVQAVRVAANNWDEMLPTVHLPASSFYLPIILGSAHGILHLLAAAAEPNAEGPNQ